MTTLELIVEVQSVEADKTSDNNFDVIELPNMTDKEVGTSWTHYAFSAKVKPVDDDYRLSEVIFCLTSGNDSIEHAMEYRKATEMFIPGSQVRLVIDQDKINSAYLIKPVKDTSNNKHINKVMEMQYEMNTKLSQVNRQEFTKETPYLNLRNCLLFGRID